MSSRRFYTYPLTKLHKKETTSLKSRSWKLERKQKGWWKNAALSRLAATKVARIQAAVADSVLLAEPSEEALETETIAAMGRASVPKEETC
jgi:hypothetical protein